MKAIICHISKKTLLQQRTESFSDEISLFRSFNNLFKIQIPCKYFFICPLEEQNFFEEYIKNTFRDDELKIKLNMTKTIGLSKDNKMETFNNNFYFDASSMMFKDFFGAWNSEYWINLCLEEEITSSIIFNLESFWFLSSLAYEKLFEYVDQNNFCLRGFFDDDILIGLDTTKAKTNLACNSKKTTDQFKIIQENFERFSNIDYGNAAGTINTLRNKNINHLLITNNHIFHAVVKRGDCEQSIDLNNINEYLMPWSFRYTFGRDLFLKYMSLCYDNDIVTLQKFNSIINLYRPLTIRILINSNFNYDIQKIQSIISQFKHSPFWIIEVIDSTSSSSILFKIIQEIKAITSSIIYLEINNFEKKHDLINYYSAGVDVLVLNIKEEETTFYDSIHNLNEQIFQAFNIKNSFKNKFILLKCIKSSNFPEMEFLLYKRWKYIVDDVIIYSSENFESEFLSNFENSECNKIYNEIIIDSNLNFSLCSQINQFDMNQFIDKTLHEKIVSLRNSNTCLNCSKKFIYSSKRLLSFNSEKLYNVFLTEKVKLNLKQADDLILNKNYFEALTSIERVLKIDIFNKNAWNKIEYIENSTKHE